MYEMTTDAERKDAAIISRFADITHAAISTNQTIGLKHSAGGTPSAMKCYLGTLRLRKRVTI